MKNQSNHAGHGVVDAKERRKREIRKDMVVWIEDMEDTMGRYKTIPPIEIILYPDLMDRAWGWSRLVLYSESDTTVVEWPDYTRYLKKYFNRNVAFLYTTSAAATYCREEETKYRTIHGQDLSADDVELSDDIQERAICVLNSEGGKRSVSAIARLMCIAEEAKLSSGLPRDDFRSMAVFSGYIRRSALNLTRYRGPESGVVAAALLGMCKETNSMRGLLNRGSTDIGVEEVECGFVREGICPLLETLENYFSCGNLPSRDISVGGFRTRKSEKPMRDSSSTVVELKSDNSNANEKPKDTDEHCGKNNHGNKKRKRSKK